MNEKELCERINGLAREIEDEYPAAAAALRTIAVSTAVNELSVLAHIMHTYVLDLTKRKGLRIP